MATGLAKSADAAKAICRGTVARRLIFTNRSLLGSIHRKVALGAYAKRGTLQREVDQ
jgi:hypothetical protein